MRFTDETVRELDELRRREQDIPNRSEMVRRLITRAYGRLKPAKGE